MAGHSHGAMSAELEGLMGVPGGPAVAGFAAGLMHVVAGPDHVAALAPLAVRNRLKAMRIGAVWGAGHGTGVLILGSLGIFAKSALDIETLSAYSESFVGFMLLGIGLWAAHKTVLLQRSGFAGKLREDMAEDVESKAAVRGPVAMHKRKSSASGGEVASEATSGGGGGGGGIMGAAPAAADDTLATPAHAHTAAFGVGVLHGAAGTGHIFGVLPSLALPPLSAASYLVSYLLGAVLAMSGVGCLLGSVGDVGGPRAILYLMGCSSATAICVGLYWIFG